MHTLRYVLFASTFCFIIFWSTKPALFALLASATFKHQLVHSSWEQDPSERLDVTRSLQNHFRKFSVYIPYEDIMFRSQSLSYQEKLFFHLDQGCGHGKVYVWIPLIIRFPLVGNKVLEWCWIPKIKTEKNQEL